MAQLIFGRTNPLQFSNSNDFFYALGFLASSKRTSIRWENNETSGAWGSEGRIHCESDLIAFPGALQNKFTKGNGSVLKRINCNEFIEYIATHHRFRLGNSQDAVAIRLTVPQAFIVDFDNGLAR